jgi:hypothetical protein
MRQTADDFQKLAECWRRIRFDGRLNISLEFATVLFRYANRGICASHDPMPEDPRQAKLDLQGGAYRPQPVRITVG